MINDFDKVGNIILSLGIRVRPVAYLYPDGRKFDLLDGEWLFQEDPINIGESEQWFKHEAKHLFRRTAKVPIPWQAQFPDLVNYTGTAWYARSFPVPQDAFFTHAFLDFTAVDHETTAWLNGKFVGHHKGGYARFAFDIGQKLIRGEENYLVIRVFDPKNNQAIPHGKQGGNWYQQISGIWGSVFVEYLRDPLVVNDVVFKPRSVEGDVEIRVQVKRLEPGNVDKVLQLRCTVENGGDEQVLLEDTRIIMPQQTLLRTFTFPAKISNPKLWSPGAPELYKANLILFEVPPNAQGEGTVVDSLSTEFGLRMVSTIRRQIRLNGRPLVLRGVLDQAFYPDTLYTPPSDDYMQEEIRAMKEMGVNLIRKHIKVEDPRYLFWCDHLGMLYWAEPPNFIIPTPKSFRLFEDTLTKMIVRDRNHPCVIIWGIFNEEWGIWGSWFGIWNRTIRRLYKLLKRLDDTRLVVDNSGWAHALTDLNDYHHYFMAPDSGYFWTKQLLAIKRIPQWNFNRTRGVDPANLPQIISEYGCGGVSDLAWMKGEPYWYRHNGNKTEIPGIVFPFQLSSRYQKCGIGKYFGTLKEFAEKSQWREFTSNKFITEEMRRLNLSGYILTELADIEWECNGLLQYDRSAKVFAQHYAIFNGDDILIIRPNKRVYQEGEQMVLLFFLSSFSDVRIEGGTLRWQIAAIGMSGEQSVTIRKYRGYLLCDISITLPQIDQAVLNTPINAQVISSVGGIFTQNFEPISIVPQNVMPNEKTATRLQVYDPGNFLTPLLEKWKSFGFSAEISHPKSAWDIQIPCIATKYDKNVRNFLRTGGRVLYSLEFLLPPKERRFAVRKPGTIHLDAIQTQLPRYLFSKKLPGLPIWVKPCFRGESWDGMFSINFADPRLLYPLPFENPLNWESNDLWPDFRLKCVRKDFLRCTLAGQVFGWVNAIYPIVFKTTLGPGTLIISTLNLLRHVGDNAVGAILFSNLLWELKKDM